MPFPFVAPLKKEIEDKLKERELYGLSNHKFSPFIILSSGAVVTNQSENILDTIKNGTYTNAYKGCVISNQTSLGLMYQSSDTILGYDLDNKQIKIKGESNRKISTPIIQSLEIDTDGGNNTLKSARVKIKVMSLKQLEMFDLFFLRPSMPVVLEYGWNTDLISKTTIDSKLISKKKYDDFVSIVTSHFTKFKESKIDYLTTLSETKYNYDYMIGKVTDFNYSPSEDGTYDVDLEISAGNELQLWMPLKQNTNKSAQAKKDKQANLFQTWLNKIYADFNLPSVISGYSEKDWKSEFFNWDMINAQEKDKTVSFNKYISFKFVLELLTLSQVFKFDKSKLVYYYEDKDKTKQIIPMNSHKFMCSTSEDLIIPNSIPSFKRNTEKGKENELILDISGSLNDCKINDKSFNITTTTIYDNAGKEYSLDTNLKYGNLLNVFINYEAVLRAYNQSYTQADFINNVLEIVNSNTFGLCKLELMSQTDDNTNALKSLSIIDYKLTAIKNSEPSKNSYKFTIGPNSILREFSFSMELSTLAQAQAMYQSQLNLNDIMSGKGLDTSVNAQLQKEAYKLFDLSYAKNSDGWFSINEIDKYIVIEAAKNAKEKEEKANVSKEPPKKEDDYSDKKPEDLAELIRQKSVNFKTNVNNKAKIKTYIFLDKGVIQNVIQKEKQGSALTYLDISLSIDGMSGFSCGEYFNIEGIPEIYNRNGYFQITNVKQGIDENGWKTTIEAGYRIDIEKAFGK